MNAITKNEILEAQDAETALLTLQDCPHAPQILALARRHLDRPDVLQAAFTALADFWPGFFASPDDMRRQIQELEAPPAPDGLPLRLIPIHPDEMKPGQAYLAATFGHSGLVGAVIQGSQPAQASQYETLFILQPVHSYERPAKLTLAAS